MENNMLTAPRVTATGLDNHSCPKPRYFKLQQPIPKTEDEVEIRLAVNEKVLYCEKKDKNQIKIIEEFTLTDFSVNNGIAMWQFTNTQGTRFTESLEHSKLTSLLSVKLCMPVVLFPSRKGFRASFRFRKYAEDKILLTAGMFNRLTGA